MHSPYDKCCSGIILFAFLFGKYSVYGDSWDDMSKICPSPKSLNSIATKRGAQITRVLQYSSAKERARSYLLRNFNMYFYLLVAPGLQCFFKQIDSTYVGTP